MGDSTNYGDAATASELLRPSVYDLYGVDEEQLLCPRSRKEVKLVLVSGLSLAVSHRSLSPASRCLSPSVMVEPLSSVSQQNDLQPCDLVSLRSLAVDPGMGLRHRARQQRWRHLYWTSTFSEAPELCSLFFFLFSSQLSQIFVGLDLSEETFEEVWKLASAEHEAGEVCVDSFCRLLEEIKAT